VKVHDAIGDIPLFKGLPQNQIAGLAAIATTRTLTKGQIVFSEGDEGTGFYVVLSGRIKIYKLSHEGKEQILHIFGSGEPFGEVAVFAGERFPAHAEAIEKTELLFCPRRAFMGLIRRDPSLAMNILALLSNRLKYFTQLVENLSLKGIPQRLAAYLLYLGDRKEGSATVKLAISKGQLASLLGTIPETLSRILSKLVNQEFIRVQGRDITVVNRKALQELAAGGKFIV
jgi:CRP/FNR family transcriptional regulator, dissimilatory nitrate respiration regulator